MFLWPYLAVLLERKIFDVPTPSSKRWWQVWKKGTSQTSETIDDDLAISVKHLNKTFRTSLFTSKNKITAVDDLSLDIPKTGIFVLLGSNGYVYHTLSLKPSSYVNAEPESQRLSQSSVVYLDALVEVSPLRVVSLVRLVVLWASFPRRTSCSPS